MSRRVKDVAYDEEDLDDGYDEYDEDPGTDGRFPDLHSYDYSLTLVVELSAEDQRACRTTPDLPHSYPYSFD